MSDGQFRADNGTQSTLKITPLIRANQLSSQSETWSAPDLQAAMLQESRRAFEQALANAKAEVAEALALMREAELKAARKAGFAEGKRLGYEKGYQQGYTEARSVAEAEALSEYQAFEQLKANWLTETQQKTESLLLGVTQSLNVVEDSLMQDILWLSSQFAQKIAMDALNIQPERVQHLVKQVIAQLPQIVYPLHIRAHPDDVVRLDPVMLARDGRVELHPDEQLSTGECVLKSGHSELSFSWKVQTEKLLDLAVQALLNLNTASLSTAES
jgi:flagellar biosynthesis/type III secretory pathway protein FliH